MNDCPNAEMRDLLPDLLHDRLTATVRAEVTAHVAECVDCREELALIRSLQTIVTVSVPRVDIANVVQALPKPPKPTMTPITTRRRTWSDWRIAAAVTLLVAGGSSVALIDRAPKIVDSVAIAPVAVSAPLDSRNAASNATPTLASAAESAAKSPSASESTHESSNDVELGAGGRLADLDDSQLKALIDEIGQMKAVPITEPEPVAIRVDPRNTSGMEDLK